MIPRRDFLRRVSGAATAVLVGLRAARADAEPPPETTRLRLIRTTNVCGAPQYLAADMLKAEGFTDVTYVEMRVGTPVSKILTAGGADLSMNFVGPNLIRVDQGDPVVVRKHPVATKRAIRAVLKRPSPSAWAACSSTRSTRPARTTAQVMKELPCGKWREYDPEDTIRFYALRLHEAGMIKTNPQELIAEASDWQFLTELRKELKDEQP